MRLLKNCSVRMILLGQKRKKESEVYAEKSMEEKLQ